MTLPSVSLLPFNLDHSQTEYSFNGTLTIFLVSEFGVLSDSGEFLTYNVGTQFGEIWLTRFKTAPSLLDKLTEIIKGRINSSSELTTLFNKKWTNIMFEFRDFKIAVRDNDPKN